VAGARKLTTSSVDRGRRLGDYLAERLALPPAEADALVRRGSVYLGRRRAADPDERLEPAVRVTVHLSPPAARPPPAPTVLFRDAEVLVVDKPAGVPTQATRASAAGALDRAVAAIDPDARLLHRIDQDASGLVLFTRTPAARRRMAALLAAGQLERTYQAVVFGHLAPERGTFSGAIGPDPRDRRRMAVGAGRPAETRFRVLACGEGGPGAPTSLVELELVTGRTHQIRAHLAHAGHPICGDRIYGAGREAGLARLYLHAHRLAWPGAPPVVSPAPPGFADLVR